MERLKTQKSKANSAMVSLLVLWREKAPGGPIPTLEEFKSSWDDTLTDFPLSVDWRSFDPRSAWDQITARSIIASLDYMSSLWIGEDDRFIRSIRKYKRSILRIVKFTEDVGTSSE